MNRAIFVYLIALCAWIIVSMRIGAAPAFSTGACHAAEYQAVSIGISKETVYGIVGAPTSEGVKYLTYDRPHATRWTFLLDPKGNVSAKQCDARPTGRSWDWGWDWSSTPSCGGG